MRLVNKVAFVTGAGSGNGAGIATGFLKEGAKVIFADLNPESARKVAIESGFSEENWLVLPIDVSDKKSVDKAVEESVKHFGTLDILVANAGITVRKFFLDMTEEDYEKVMRVNSKGVFLCSQAAAKVMADKGGGSIIHIASLSSIVAPLENIVGYGASKGAVLSMTRHMARDLGGLNIRVNAIAPGTILTNLNKARLTNSEDLEKEQQKIMLGRIGSPNDLVGAAVFLASEESSFMTGGHIVIDGGETAQ